MRRTVFVKNSVSSQGYCCYGTPDGSSECMNYLGWDVGIETPIGPVLISLCDKHKRELEKLIPEGTKL